MTKRTLLAFGLLTFGLLPVACGDSNEDGTEAPYVPPSTGGTGGWDPGDGGTSASGGNGATAGSGGTAGAAGTGGDLDAGPDQEAGPPACANEYKRCDYEFTYPAGSETSVEVRGSFAADGWDQGVAMTKSGSNWTATVPVPYDFELTYKFVIDGTTWVVDPNNPNTVPDGQGGEKSVLAGQTCSWWSCVADPAPADCAESARTCDTKFVYPYGGETSVTLKGSFDAWGAGYPMTNDGTNWSVVVDDLAWGSAIQYKFVIDGTNWVTDPNNPNQIDDNGNINSLLSDLTCEWWTCEGTVNPDAFDWRDAVLYFVFTDRFNNGNASNDGSPTGNGVEPAADYQGGDFAGITAKIEAGYFDEMGVNVLWISPPMDNTSSAGVGVGGDTHMYSAYHGYWVSDAEKTEERFGTMAELKAMVDAAHDHDIRVLFDYPMNHVHQDSPIYTAHQDDWFWQPPCICGDGCSWDGAEGKKCWFTSYLPDFNFTKTQPREWSVSNAMWWIEQTGIDGFRLDAVKHIEDQWLIDLRSRLKNEVEPVTQEHFYLVGETFTGDRGTIGYYVNPSMLDGQFEFPLRLKLVSTMLMRTEPMSALESELGTYESYYGSNAIMSTFVGNHDVPRPIHFAEDSPISTNVWYDGKDRAWSNKPGLPGGAAAFERLANAFTVLFTIKGVPLIYYGDEVGLPGAGDPDNRRFMQWSGYSAGQTALHEHIKKLGQIRADHAALRRGTRTSVHTSNDVYAYKMSASGDDVYVVVNRADTAQQASGLPSGTLTDLISGSTVTGPSFSVPARSSMILTQ